MKIGNKKIGGEELFFVVEEGVANLGSKGKAFKMIDAIAECKADAVEFQVFNANDFVIKSHPSHKALSEIELSINDWKEIIRYTHQKDLLFIATALCSSMVAMLVEAGCDAFNINATDINNPDIIDTVVESNLPFFISIPLASEQEIDWIVERVKQQGTTNFAILHGQHTMFSNEGGIPLEQTDLGVIRKLQEKYNIPVGFVDHTPKIWMPSVAVASGANIITKHLAIKRTDKGPDWHICLEPNEMKEAIVLARNANISIRANSKQLAEGEELDIPVMRKSIVSAQDLQKGHIIQKNDILFKRPGNGISPDKYEILLGKALAKDIKADEIINLKDLK